MQDAPGWMWATLVGATAALLAVDIAANRGARTSSRAASIGWTIAWFVAGLLFAGVVLFGRSGDRAEEYTAAYLIERALSVDNVFVFLVIFASLKVRDKDQQPALFWGILAALVLRAVFIALGLAVIERIAWLTYAFAALLVYAAFRVWREHPLEQKESGLTKRLRRRFPKMSPFALAIGTLGLADVMFAIDSVPAALSVTRDAYVIYAANLFSVLGLRPLYAVLVDLVARLAYLHFGLAAVLAFAALKLVSRDVVEIPPLVSVGVIVAVLGAAIVASALAPAREKRRARQRAA